VINLKAKTSGEDLENETYRTWNRVLKMYLEGKEYYDVRPELKSRQSSELLEAALSH
jgi:hypothetical protein